MDGWMAGDAGKFWWFLFKRGKCEECPEIFRLQKCVLWVLIACSGIMLNELAWNFRYDIPKQVKFCLSFRSTLKKSFNY